MNSLYRQKKRSRKKLFIWLSSILGVLIVIVGVGGYFTINYAADKVLDSMMEEAIQPADSASDIPSSGPEASTSPSASDSEITDTGEPNQSSDSREASPSETPDAESAKPSDPPSKPSSPSSKPTPSPSPSYQAEISTDKAEDVKENITFAEKTKVLAVMLKRLSADDIKTLQQLANGGLSVEKKKEAKEIILQKLNEDEYNDLIAIAKKYGLSQGKSYADSQKEDLSK